jgi:hypothetical protein
MQSKAGYIPGVCNIGPSEIKTRSQTGWIGLGSTIILGAALFLFSVHSAWRVLLFFPAFIAAIGFLQAKMRFCAAFGILGVFNFGPKVGRSDTVAQTEYRRKDRKKATLIIFYSIMIAIVVAIVGYLV